MTFVIATGGIDLSVGSVMAIAGALSAVQLGHGAIAADLIALGGALAIGGLNGALVSRDLGGRAPQAIVITLATLIAGRGLAQVLSNDGQLVSVSDPTFELLGRGHVGPVPVPVLIAALAGIVATLVLRTTSFGRYVLAVGGNRAAARLAGVPVRLTLLSVYIISALLSAVAGLLEVSRAGASDAAKLGLTIELDAIAAVVIGGTVLSGGRATILGTIVGALVMQVIATSFNMLLVPYAWSLVLKAVIIVVAVYAQRGRRV
jgi:simple sugar transport system permease protein/ribose transport system permease protein